MATSSTEAELYAGNCAAAESMGVQAFARDPGRAVPIRLHIDSGAALCIISRTGLGKATQVEIQYLWLQEAVRNKKWAVEKIPSETTSSDLGTRHPHEREIRDVDEVGELLHAVNSVPVGFVLGLRSWIGDLAHFWMRSREERQRSTNLLTRARVSQSPSKTSDRSQTSTTAGSYQLLSDRWEATLSCEGKKHVSWLHARACGEVPRLGFDRTQQEKANIPHARGGRQM